MECSVVVDDLDVLNTNEVKCLQKVDNKIWIAEKDGDIVIRSREGVIEHQVSIFQQDYPWCMMKRRTHVWIGYSSGCIRVYCSTTPYNIIHERAEHTGGVYCLVTVDTWVFSASSDFEIRQWNAESAQLVHIYTGHDKSVRCLSTLSNSLFSGSEDTTICCWDIQSKTLKQAMRGHKEAVLAMTLSHGDALWTASEDSTVRVWDTKTFRLIQTLTHHTAGVTCLANVGDFVLSGSVDSQICMWDSRSHQCIHSLLGHTGYINTIGFTAAAVKYTFWSASSDRTIRRWTFEIAGSSMDQDASIRLGIPFLENNNNNNNNNNNIDKPRNNSPTPDKSAAVESHWKKVVQDLEKQHHATVQKYLSEIKELKQQQTYFDSKLRETSVLFDAIQAHSEGIKRDYEKEINDLKERLSKKPNPGRTDTSPPNPSPTAYNRPNAEVGFIMNTRNDLVRLLHELHALVLRLKRRFNDVDIPVNSSPALKDVNIHIEEVSERTKTLLQHYLSDVEKASLRDKPVPIVKPAQTSPARNVSPQRRASTDTAPRFTQPTAASSNRNQPVSVEAPAQRSISPGRSQAQADLPQRVSNPLLNPVHPIKTNPLSGGWGREQIRAPSMDIVNTENITNKRSTSPQISKSKEIINPAPKDKFDMTIGLALEAKHQKIVSAKPKSQPGPTTPSIQTPRKDPVVDNNTIRSNSPARAAPSPRSKSADPAKRRPVDTVKPLTSTPTPPPSDPSLANARHPSPSTRRSSSSTTLKTDTHHTPSPPTTTPQIILGSGNQYLEKDQRRKRSQSAGTPPHEQQHLPPSTGRPSLDDNNYIHNHSSSELQQPSRIPNVQKPSKPEPVAINIGVHHVKPQPTDHKLSHNLVNSDIQVPTHNAHQPPVVAVPLPKSPQSIGDSPHSELEEERLTIPLPSQPINTAPIAHIPLPPEPPSPRKIPLPKSNVNIQEPEPTKIAHFDDPPMENTILASTVKPSPPSTANSSPTPTTTPPSNDYSSRMAKLKAGILGREPKAAVNLKEKEKEKPKPKEKEKEKQIDSEDSRSTLQRVKDQQKALLAKLEKLEGDSSDGSESTTASKKPRRGTRRKGSTDDDDLEVSSSSDEDD